MECPFKIGDKIRHKASGEVGVVKHIRTRCIKHSVVEHSKILIWKYTGRENTLGECDQQWSGWLDIDTRIHKGVLTVEGYLFELVK